MTFTMMRMTCVHWTGEVLRREVGWLVDILEMMLMVMTNMMVTVIAMIMMFAMIMMSTMMIMTDRHCPLDR